MIEVPDEEAKSTNAQIIDEDLNESSDVMSTTLQIPTDLLSNFGKEDQKKIGIT